MRIGFLASPFNLQFHKGFPFDNLRMEAQKRNHDVVILDTSLANKVGDSIHYPTLTDPGTLDCFLTWIPNGDNHETNFGHHILSEPASDETLSYFEQLEWLSDKVASPMPFKAQKITNDKWKMANMFRDAALPMPQTMDGNDPHVRLNISNYFNQCATPKTFVTKPKFGYGGYWITKFNTDEDVQTLFDYYDDEKLPFIVQEYIESHGVDYRAFVIGNHVVASIRREAQNGNWISNFQQGSKVSAYLLSEQQQQDAIKAIQSANLAFGAVDILINPETNQHFICEINDHAGTESIETTHENLNVASLVFDMLEEKYAP